MSSGLSSEVVVFRMMLDLIVECRLESARRAADYERAVVDAKALAEREAALSKRLDELLQWSGVVESASVGHRLDIAFRAVGSLNRFLRVCQQESLLREEDLSLRVVGSVLDSIAGELASSKTKLRNIASLLRDNGVQIPDGSDGTPDVVAAVLGLVKSSKPAGQVG